MHVVLIIVILILFKYRFSSLVNEIKVNFKQKYSIKWTPSLTVFQSKSNFYKNISHHPIQRRYLDDSSPSRVETGRCCHCVSS